ncbi:unnamed protein product, partial [Staurois parvus]
WSVHTPGTVQNTSGSRQGRPAVSVLGTTSDQQTAAAPRALSSRQPPGTRSHGQCAGSLSSSPQGTQQQTASRDTQPWTVCRVPQQQLPGHSAADRVQGCLVDRLTDWQGLSCGV